MLIANSESGLAIDPMVVLPKPINTAPQATIEALEADDRLMITRKRDGHTAPITVAGSKSGDVCIFTAAHHDVTDKFLHLVDEVRSLNIPSQSLLQGEVLVTVDGKDDRSVYQRIASSKPENARAIQADIGLAKLVLFNVWQVNGLSLVETPFESRYSQLGEWVSGDTHEHVSVVELLASDLHQAQDQSVSSDWEGLVLYDRQAGSKVRMDGRKDLIPRPKGCWKWKPEPEDDFVVTGWAPSTAGSHAGGVKEFLIAQYHPVTGELVDCGKVGKGFSREDRLHYADDLLYPMVAEVKFEQRTKNGKLFHSSLVRFRTDKTPEQCLFPI